jgi:hypothetical protein
MKDIKKQFLKDLVSRKVTRFMFEDYEISFHCSTKCCIFTIKGGKAIINGKSVEVLKIAIPINLIKDSDLDMIDDNRGFYESDLHVIVNFFRFMPHLVRNDAYRIIQLG